VVDRFVEVESRALQAGVLYGINGNVGTIEHLRRGQSTWLVGSGLLGCRRSLIQIKPPQPSELTKLADLLVRSVAFPCALTFSLGATLNRSREE
jgi:hypothetical protein